MGVSTENAPNSLATPSNRGRLMVPTPSYCVRARAVVSRRANVLWHHWQVPRMIPQWQLWRRQIQFCSAVFYYYQHYTATLRLSLLSLAQTIEEAKVISDGSLARGRQYSIVM